MNYRAATPSDIPSMHEIRMSVKENVLSDPSLVQEKDYVYFITIKGKGWVCESGKGIEGFSIIDVTDKNIWALFVKPGSEGKGIGKKLHDLMIDWYFHHYNDILWLGTSPGTRAEKFYRKAGWIDKGIRNNGEIRFEMDRSTWTGKGWLVD